jgi:hypothetical protein
LPSPAPELANINAPPLGDTNALALSPPGSNAIPLEILQPNGGAADPILAVPNPATNGDPTADLPAPAADPLTPQMMMHFFQNEGTNGIPGRRVTVPLTFVPPVPTGPRPSSKAVVTTPPSP